MQNRIGPSDIRRDDPLSSSPFPATTEQANEALRRVTAAQIGPRRPGTVYDNAAGLFQVLAVVTDTAEARRILKRRAARFAILIRDLHAGTEHYTGATWTGSDRVLKAVTV
jgi:hypothetical protein